MFHTHCFTVAILLLISQMELLKFQFVIIGRDKNEVVVASLMDIIVIMIFKWQAVIVMRKI